MKVTIRLMALLCAAAPLTLCAAEPGGQTTTVAPARPANPSDLFTNVVVAKGKGVSVSRAQLDEVLIGMKSRASAQGQFIPPQQETLLERQLLQRLIHLQLLGSKATDADKAAGKEVAQERLAEMLERAGSEERLDQQLKAVGLTRDELTSRMNEEATAEAVLKRELQPEITDEAVRKFYDENPAEFEQPEMVRAAHILLSIKDSSDPAPNPAMQRELPDEQKEAKRKQIDELLKRARAGEDFAALAKAHSEDPGSKETGGEYTFPRGRMTPAFETAAFGLQTNEVSEVIATPYGYHIIKLYEKMPAKTLAFDEVKDDVKQFLSRQQIQRQIPEHMEKMETEAEVEILDERLKPVEPEIGMPQPPAGAPAGGHGPGDGHNH